MNYWKFDNYGIAVPWIQGVPYPLFTSSLLQGIFNNQASVTSDILPGGGREKCLWRKWALIAAAQVGKVILLPKTAKADTIQDKLMSRSSVAN
jgi:hypothetical protein